MSHLGAQVNSCGPCLTEKQLKKQQQEQRDVLRLEHKLQDAIEGFEIMKKNYMPDTTAYQIADAYLVKIGKTK